MVRKEKEKVAVIGAGVSGLAASWLLSQNSDRFNVTLYEKQTYFGGHSNTVEFPIPADEEGLLDGRSIPVDTGFIVFNKKTYPNLVRFLHHLEVPYEKSDMSFAVSRNHGEFEWAGQSLGTVFAQWRNLVNPSFLRTLLDILRFNTVAKDLLKVKESPKKNKDNQGVEEMSVGEYLSRHGYAPSFANDYLLPMTAAIWSTPAEKCWMEFPMVTLVQFMDNHGLLSVLNHPKWYTISGGSREYVKKVLAQLKDARIADPVQSVRRAEDVKSGKTKVRVVTSSGSVELYDYVIFATHGDEARELLKDPNVQEKAMLEPIQFTKNRAVLHRDEEIMPRIRSTWSSWNYMTKSTNEATTSAVCLTYWMNRLQNIDAKKYGHVFVTMNPIVEPRVDKTVQSFAYTHPLYNQELIASQKKLQAMNAEKQFQDSRVLFAGAWTRYGFHEDGLTSGLVAAQLLEAHCPFPIEQDADAFAQAYKGEEENVEKVQAWWWAWVWLMLEWLVWCVFHVWDAGLVWWTKRSMQRVSTAQTLAKKAS